MSPDDDDLHRGEASGIEFMHQCRLDLCDTLSDID